MRKLIVLKRGRKWEMVYLRVLMSLQTAVQVGKVQASVARCLRTPPYAAKRKDLGFDSSNRLRGQSNRSTIVICNCTFRADTVAPRRDKA